MREWGNEERPREAEASRGLFQLTNSPTHGFASGFLGQACTIARPIRAIVTCASLSISQRWSAFSFVRTHATTRDCRGKNAHSVRTWSVAPVLCGTVRLST